MNVWRNHQKIIAASLLGIYLLVLTWIILFKMSVSLEEIPNFRGMNFIPFEGTTIVNNQLDVSEIINNVLIFIPLGIYISLLQPTWSFLKRIAPIVATSLLFEIIQYSFAIGGMDITDLIGNTLGGTLGIFLYVVIFKLFSTKANPILLISGMIGTIGVVLDLIFFNVLNV